MMRGFMSSTTKSVEKSRTARRADTQPSAHLLIRLPVARLQRINSAIPFPNWLLTMIKRKLLLRRPSYLVRCGNANNPLTQSNGLTYSELLIGRKQFHDCKVQVLIRVVLKACCQNGTCSQCDKIDMLP